MSQPASRPPVEIRPAHDAEAAACRVLLRDTFDATHAPVLYVAVGDGAIVGAAAVGWVPGGFPVKVHVVPAWRRRGVGLALLDAVAEATTGETSHLRAWTLVGEHDAAQRFLSRAAFVVRHRFHGFETDGVAFAATIGKLRDRLAKAGRIPGGMAVVAPAAAPRGELVGLVARSLDAVPASVAARIAGEGPSGYDDALSVVLVLHGAVAGAMLSTRDGSVARIEVSAVAPALRRGWANVVLLDETVRRGIAGGIRSFRFFCDEHTRDTMNLARRSGARPLGVGVTMERSLG